MNGRSRRSLTLIVSVATLVTAAVAWAGCGDESDSDSGGSADTDSVYIGIAAAKTGALATYDTEWAQAFQLGIEEINQAGGILGKQVRTKWIDTKTDRATSAVVGRELLDDGADALAVTGDFDYGAPAAIEANQRQRVAISFGAGDPKFADASTIGPYAFTFGPGGAELGAGAAEFAYDQGWKRVYVFTDQSLEVMKANARYFMARLEELGGEAVFEDKFNGVANVNIRTQITRLRGSLDEIDANYIASYTPPGAEALRQLREAGVETPVLNGIISMYGPSLTQITGPLKDYFANGYACVVDCSGEDNPKVDKFMALWQGKYGKPPTTASHPVLGYDLAHFFKAAIEEAGTTDGDKLQETIESMDPVSLALGDIKMTKGCHRPDREFAYIHYGSDKVTFVERRGVEKVPDLGDSLPCG